ncbi:hypothetical protein Rsub_09309 [Raphidocelis subcapitata]|uniref:PIG-P domain-containing protein n=1 Tax=Raphidocelis subcapitata TaxID=307507 RepID=A0A2V0PA05_9CHLO|nr:hypothetical protein Rsub_09309 [Raphidocelis subcapitata]|eukprot:GBF96676.1 hypothetical protein Rsub_09309 [Raphidocelis subcapitata]
MDRTGSGDGTAGSEPRSGRGQARAETRAGVVGAPPSGGAASSVEVYGFVGWITSAVAFALYVLWAALPESQLRRVGITYYPSKHWALAVPLWLLLGVAWVYWAYEGLNAMVVPPLSSLTTLQDANCKWGGEADPGAPRRAIPPLSHVPPAVVSRVLHGGESLAEAQAAEGARAPPRRRPPPRGGGIAYAPMRKITLADVAIAINGKRVDVTLPLPAPPSPPVPPGPRPPPLPFPAPTGPSPSVDVRISDLGLPGDAYDTDRGSGRRRGQRLLRGFLLLTRADGGAGGIDGGGAPGDPPPRPAEQQAAVAALAAGLEQPNPPDVNLSQVKGMASGGGDGGSSGGGGQTGSGGGPGPPAGGSPGPGAGSGRG